MAVVTGAGHGLGRSYALALAERGARVVVNDVGGARDGTGSSRSVAEAVVDEILAAGGEAMASAADVTDETAVAAMVAEAVDRWGRINILINNAGVLRDRSLANMTMGDFRFVVEVHLMGTVICTKAVWGHMKEANYGRIVVTSSSSGLYGNFGQTNYGAAKLGVVGFMNTLRLEGDRYGIRVNALAPAAHTRMTEELLPEEAKVLLEPEAVTPAVLFLVSEDAPQGMILTAGAGGYGAVRIHETRGIWLAKGDRTPEMIASRIEEIIDAEGQVEFRAGSEQTMKFLASASDSP